MLYYNSLSIYQKKEHKNSTQQYKNSILHNITYSVIQLLINKLRITLFNSFHSIH